MVKARRVVSAFALLATIACGDDDGSGPTGSIAITASPTSLTLAQGATGTVTVSLTRGGGFSEAVSVTVEGMPAGVTATVAPAQLTGTTTSATVTVNVASTVPAGTYPITVRASATGIGAATATYSLIVTATGNFTVSATPAALNLAAGASGNTSVAIVRTNLTTDVALSLVNAPTGITGVFTPATLSGATLTSTLALTVASNVAAGTYPVTVRGTAGSVTQNTTVNVIVTAPTGGNIVWEFCNSDDVPLKFWFLNGATWTEVAPAVVGATTRFSFAPSGTYAGVAFTVTNTSSMIKSAETATTRLRTTLRNALDARKRTLDARARITSQDVGQLTSPFFDTFVILALTSEIAGFRQTCTASTALVTKNFTLTGQAASEDGQLGYGIASTSLTSQTASYNLQVPAGTYDWLAMWGPSPTFPSLAHAWSSYRLGRGEAAPGGSVAINRTGATALSTTPFTVTGGAGGSFYS